jgi:ribosomal protein L19E
MSELVEINDEAPLLWRVRKVPDHAIYGPVDPETLKEWANSAQIAPHDEIDLSDEAWKPAPEVEFLEMHWLVTLPDDESYGPTTLGTLREFIHEGLITEKTLATHAKTKQSLPIAALLAAVDFEKKRASRRPVREEKKSTASIAVDMAKDQRIRQLEEDLRELRKEHEELTHRYRQLSLQLQGAAPKVGRR